MKDEVDKLLKVVADDVSKDMDSAIEYLKEEGVEYEKITKDLVGKIKSFIATGKSGESGAIFGIAFHPTKLEQKASYECYH